MMKPLIIDAEIHLLHPDACAPNFSKNMDEPVRKAIHEHPDFTALADKLSFSSLEHSMDENDIHYGILMGMSWRDKGILNDNNQYISEMVSASNGRYKGMYIPHLKDISRAVSEIEQLDESIFEGVKILPAWQGVHVDDEKLQRIFDVIKDRNMYLMVHTDHMTQSLDGDTPFRLLRFLQKNPELKVLAPHMGGMICLYALREGVRQAIQNVTFITSVSATMPFVNYAADINPSNIIFGTDFPFNHCHDQKTQIDAVMNSGLSEKIIRNIMGEKAKSLFQFGSDA